MRTILLLIIAVVLASSAPAGTLLLMHAGAGAPGGAAPGSPCAAWQLDFSDATGCNLTLAGH